MGRARWLSSGLALGLVLLPGAARGQPSSPSPAAEVEPQAIPAPKTASDAKAPAPAEAQRPSNVIVPLAMYTPETHVGLGALFVHFFRPPVEKPNERVSSFAFFAIGTTRRQAILEAHPDFFFGDLHFFGKVEFQYFPDSFWGIGPHTQDEDEERYSRQRFRIKGGGHHRIVGALHAGVAIDVMDYHATYGQGGIFANETIPGERGGVTSGLGPSIAYDTRDNHVEAHSGTLLGSSFLWFGEPISRYTFRKFVLDARQFFDLGMGHALGAHFYAEFQGGFVPYYHLAMLGGDELLRGYYYGRYRDESLAALEVEYRYPIYWKFGGVLFAGAGGVAANAGDLFHEPIRWSVGGGGRFSLSDEDRLNLRLDAGFGIGTWGLYFTAREAF